MRERESKDLKLNCLVVVTTSKIKHLNIHLHAHQNRKSLFAH